MSYTPEDAKSRIVKRAAKYVDIIDSLNGTTRANGEPLCATLALRKVVFAGSTKNVDNEGFEHILIQFKTKPGKGFYESKVRYSNATEEYKIGHRSSADSMYTETTQSVSTTSMWRCTVSALMEINEIELEFFLGFN